MIESPKRWISDEVLERLNRPADQARGLPNEAFTSEQFFELERRSLFPHTWVFALPASDVPNAGDMRPIELAGQPLIAARDERGGVRVFANVCPHRGARLLFEAASGVQSITCPYHAWSFDLSGKLKGRPHFHGPDRHDKADQGDEMPCLFEMTSHTWYDWVFVNLDGKASDFETYVAPFTEQFAGFDLSDFQPAFRKSFEFNSNWKLTIENYCDFYHVFKVHPALHQMMAREQRRAMQIGGAHLFNGYSFAGSGRGLVVNEEKDSLPMIEGLVPERQQSMVYGALFPSVAINVYPTNLQFVAFEPLSADRTTMHMWFYFVGGGATDARHAETRETLYNEWTTLNSEDLDICRRIQQGRRCDAYDGGRLAPYWDTGTLHFHRQVADAINQQGYFATN